MSKSLIYIDPSTPRKKSQVEKYLELRDGIPLPSVVEFNLTGSCNRNCSFCPVSDKTFFKKTNDNISIELYTKIMYDLEKINYNGKILYSAFCEPLLHRKLNDLIRITKEILPNSFLEMISNGDLVEKDKLKKMYDLGLDTILVSLYDGPHQLDHYKKMKDEIKANDYQLILRRRYYENGNYGLTITNRTGLVDSNKYRDENEVSINKKKLPLKKKCFYPFYMVVIDYTGDMLICTHDWRKETTKIGNLNNISFMELWNGIVLNKYRRTLAVGNRTLNPCDKCDAFGTLMGKEHFEEWKTISHEE